MDDGYSNKLFFAGEIVSLEPVRFSPAGIPIARAIVRHESWQAGQKMQCDLAVAAQAGLADKLSKLEPGKRIRISGSLTQVSRNSRMLLMWIENLTEE